MDVRLYMDVHIPMAITRQLRLRGVDVFAATEEGTNKLSDEALLKLASEQNCTIFTHDIRFRVLAESWQRTGRAFAGLIYGHAEAASIGAYVRDLELIAKACDARELQNQIIHL